MLLVPHPPLSHTLETCPNASTAESQRSLKRKRNQSVMLYRLSKSVCSSPVRFSQVRLKPTRQPLWRQCLQRNLKTGTRHRRKWPSMPRSCVFCHRVTYAFSEVSASTQLTGMALGSQVGLQAVQAVVGQAAACHRVIPVFIPTPIDQFLKATCASGVAKRVSYSSLFSYLDSFPIRPLDTRLPNQQRQRV
jgi:hypothetical protein